jgi:hypothetical protein
VQNEGSDQRGGWGDQAQLYKYNGNLLHLSAFSSLEVVAGSIDFRGQKILVRVRKRKICWQKVVLSGISEVEE